VKPDRPSATANRVHGLMRKLADIDFDWRRDIRMVGARLQRITCEDEDVWMVALGRTLHNGRLR
jgi:hypothetical protein